MNEEHRFEVFRDYDTTERLQIGIAVGEMRKATCSCGNWIASDVDAQHLEERHRGHVERVSAGD